MKDERHSPGQAVDADAMFGLRVFGVHLDVELFVHQHHEGDGARVGLHVQQERVLHHQPAAQRHNTVRTLGTPPPS